MYALAVRGKVLNSAHQYVREQPLQRMPTTDSIFDNNTIIDREYTELNLNSL